MPTRIRQLDQLTAPDWDAWRDLLRNRQLSSSGLASPFLRPEFAQCVAAVRSDVRVAVWEEDGRPTRFWAFQQRGRGARPVGAGVCEWQAVVAHPDDHWTWSELLRDCRLRCFSFDHLATEQLDDSVAWVRRGDSPWVDLAQGFESYRRGRLAAGRTVQAIERKRRRLERELGPLRFELHAPVEPALACLLEWKRAQHRRTEVLDAFDIAWIVELLRRVAHIETPGFGGLLSTLSAGERIVAVHLAVRSHDVAHVWYPAYDRELARHSPGLILLLDQIEALANQGYRRLDFGPGGQRYKTSLQTDVDSVAQGVVDGRPFVSALRRSWHACQGRLRTGPWAAALRTPWRMATRARQRRELQ